MPKIAKVTWILCSHPPLPPRSHPLCSPVEHGLRCKHWTYVASLPQRTLEPPLRSVNDGQRPLIVT